ncbi:ankyrin repeat domain-containing protein [Legionella sp. MW5194]|uniref:ankyrin repeat domain-containing protein n=1 Tax=Legionella sp. MW5194 TaxID=2662448 RepID=UPI00193CB281|nr:ankyrin repeat domain-containing protein [Legionella sp. MW5194]
MPKHTIDTGRPHRISQISVDHINKQCHFIVSAPDHTPDIKMDEIKADVIAHLQRVFGRFFDPKGFKMEFKPTGVEFRYTITDKATLLPAFLKFAKYRTYLERIKEDCIDDITKLINSKPQQKLEGNPDIGFDPGLRTQMHQHEHGEDSDIIEYKSKKYRFCTGSINFAAEAPARVASVGHTREIILLDPDSDRMQELYQEFEKDLARLGNNVPLEDVFRQARRFSNNKIDNTDFEPDAKARNTLRVGKRELPLYTLEEIIEQRKGVCRHHALFTAFLLGQYIKNQSIANAGIYHCRDSWTHPRKKEPVAHTWVVCKQNNTLYLIDSMWNVQYNLSDYTGYSKACQAYTKEVIDRTLERAHLKPPVKRRLAPAPKPELGMEVPKDPVSEKTQQLKAQLDLLEEADCKVIRRLIEQGADVNAQGVKGWTAAHVAARKDDRLLILFLKEKNANFNLKSSTRQRSPLFYAQNRVMIELLVDGGADPSQEDASPQRVTPLREHEKIISANDLLIREIDKINGANLDLIKKLIVAGADVNAQGNFTGWTAAHLAADKNDNALLELLIEKKADFNLKSSKRGRSPLFYAQTREMVLQLVTNDANLLQEDANSTTTPLKELLEKRIVTAEELLKNELDKETRADSRVIKALIEAGADANTQGKSGRSAVHYAAERGDNDLLDLLVKKKADLNLRALPKGGRSPLFYVRDAETALFLIQQGANLLQKDSAGITPLQSLLTRNIFTADKLLNRELEKRDHANPALIKALIAEGADINLQGTKSGWTAVHCATQWDNAPLLEFLIARHADLNLKTKTSQSSPLFYARSPGVVELLISHQADYMQTNGKQPAYQALLTRPDLNATEVKRLLLSQELKKTGFRNINVSFLAACTPEDDAQQVKLLHSLGCFLENQIQRLETPSRFTKGKDDKVTLYRSLINEIQEALKEGDLGNDTIKNLIYQAATISHHRRYRTANKAAAFFSAGCYSVEAESWKHYKAWVNSLKTADPESPFLSILSDSTAIRKNRLAITLPAEDGSLTEARGYDEYRAKKLKP